MPQKLNWIWLERTSLKPFTKKWKTIFLSRLLSLQEKTYSVLVIFHGYRMHSSSNDRCTFHHWTYNAHKCPNSYCFMHMLPTSTGKCLSFSILFLSYSILLLLNWIVADVHSDTVVTIATASIATSCRNTIPKSKRVVSH